MDTELAYTPILQGGGGDFATGIFRCGKFCISNVREIFHFILSPLCEINSSQNLATWVRHHAALVWGPMVGTDRLNVPAIDNFSH